jgi:prevent-host-death family protein
MPTKTPRMVGVTEARERFKDLLEEVVDRDIIFLRRSKPAAMLVSPERIGELQEMIETLEDEKAILLSKLEPQETVSHKDLMDFLGLDGGKEPTAATG